MALKGFVKKTVSIYRAPGARFIFIGLCNFKVTFITYTIALSFFSFKFAYILGFIAALIFTTLMNIKHVFSRDLTSKKAIFYGFYYFCYSFLSYKIVELLIEEFQINEIISLVLTIVAVTPCHFLFSRWLISFAEDTQVNRCKRH